MLKFFVPLASVILVLTLPATAQQSNTQEAETGETTSTLDNLRQLHSELGEIINQLELDLAQRQRLEDRVSELERRFSESALQQARQDLFNLRPTIEAGEDPEGVAEEIGQIAGGLERAYMSADDFDIDRQRVGKELTTKFDALTKQVLEGGDAATSYEDVVAELELALAQSQEGSARQNLQRTLTGAREQLGALRADLEADGDRERAAQQIGDIRSGLERAYISAGDFDVDKQAVGKELTTNFDALIRQVTEGDEGALTAYDELLGRLDQQLEQEQMMEGQESQDEQEDQEEEQNEQDQDEQQGGETGTQEAAVAFQWQELGQEVYAASCAACHQVDGQGLPPAFPALVGNEFVTGEPAPVIATVLNGRGGMPSFGGSLTAEEVAAVISHARTSWGNEAPAITPEMVSAVREGEEITDEMLDPTARPGAAD